MNMSSLLKVPLLTIVVYCYERVATAPNHVSATDSVVMGFSETIIRTVGVAVLLLLKAGLPYISMPSMC